MLFPTDPIVFVRPPPTKLRLPANAKKMISSRSSPGSGTMRHKATGGCGAVSSHLITSPAIKYTILFSPTVANTEFDCACIPLLHCTSKRNRPSFDLLNYVVKLLKHAELVLFLK